MPLTISRHKKRYILPIIIFVFILMTTYSWLSKTFQTDELKRSAELSAELAILQRKANAENEVAAGFRNKHNKVAGSLHMTNVTELRIDDGMTVSHIEQLFNRFLQQKKILCDNDVRLGFQHDGGWNVCMSPPFTLNKSCLVYSFGIGGDWRFEDDLNDFYGCTVMAFDPSMNLNEHTRKDRIHFKPEGLAGENDFNLDADWTLKTFREHLRDAGHLNRVIDYLKFDIEYYEWSALKWMLSDDSLHNVKQLAFEVHLFPPPFESEIEYKPSKIDLLEKYDLLKKLEDLGFLKFNYRLNPFGEYLCKAGKNEMCSSFYELHYLNLNYVETKHFK
ncbi:uncharacterized protein LOC128222493 [Mya arenaria]|uniref:uncharacterized protein LOC128222493 n=1 Tax=Mya arenaria TaxID=6604 RepID=UPI0022E2F45E|nr:uncharacterized protein LOC128222493 [Mya arenaria]